MFAWEAIQNSINYIEKHLTEEINIQQLSHEAALSPYYFQRLFRRLLNKPVHDYIRLRRLAKASEGLISKEKRILDIALDYQFSDHSNFTRAFKEAYGLTPEEHRNNPVILNHYVKPDLSLSYMDTKEETTYIADGIIIEVSRRALGEERSFMGMEGEIPFEELSIGKNTGIATAGILWEEFHRQKPKIPKLLPLGNEIGVITSKESRLGCCTYFVGAEIQESVRTRKYATFQLPIGEYIVCRFEAESFSELISSAIYKAITFMKHFMKQQKLASKSFTVEMYYPYSPDSCIMELWLPLNSSQRRTNTTILWDKLSQSQKPDMELMGSYVNNPLWDNLCSHIEAEYQCKPVLEYSKCSMQQGWNVKYKKAGRSLCTLYPLEGYYIALVVIGEKERNEVEFMLPSCTQYLQQLYEETKIGMGQKWLMIQVRNESVLEDVKHCIAIRRGIRK